MAATIVNDAGLCASCAHCRLVHARRSTFHMCLRSFTDERFAKYPRLPVVRCIGYSPGVPTNASGASETPDLPK